MIRRSPHVSSVWRPGPASGSFLKFHTRVLGFERIGTHRHGELACASARIILILDIARAWQRLERRGNKVFRELGEGLRERIAGRLPVPVR